MPAIWTLIAALALYAAPARILVVYHSETGNTEALARSVRDGVATVSGAEAVLRKTADVTDAEVRDAAGILLGTPVHWGTLSAGAKQFLDRTAAILAKQGKALGEGRTGGVFTTGGSPSNGQELARLTAIAAFLAMRFVVVGGENSEGFGNLGAQAVGKPNPAALAEARQFGIRFARITVQLRGK